VTRPELLAWLESRRPAPPAALANRLAECVTAAPDGVLAGDSVAEAVGRLGLVTLRAVVERQGVAYDAAMDLLAADAFVTYAFEAAAEGGGELSSLAGRLLAAVGT